MSFGADLRAARIAAGFPTIRGASQETGISERILSALERGEVMDRVTPFHILQLAKKYKCKDLVYAYLDICPLTSYIRADMEQYIDNSSGRSMFEQFQLATWDALEALGQLADQEPIDDPAAFAEHLKEMNSKIGEYLRVVSWFRMEYCNRKP